MKSDIERVDRIPSAEAAAILGTSFEVMKSAMLNGTLPIGFVGRKEGSSRDSVHVIRSRFEAWIAARDLKPGDR